MARLPEGNKRNWSPTATGTVFTGTIWEEEGRGRQRMMKLREMGIEGGILLMETLVEIPV